MHPQTAIPVMRKVADSLHVEAMVLADEARSYFDGIGLSDRSDLDPTTRVIFSCEALKVTTRLMHSVAWLLSHRSAQSESLRQRMGPVRLGSATHTDAMTRAKLPQEAQRVIAASEDIYDRIARIDAAMRWPTSAVQSPALNLQRHLERAL
jgi:regulator of CtrA degradation